MRKNIISYFNKIASGEEYELISEIKDLASEEPIRKGERDSDFSKPYISFLQEQLTRIGFESPFKKGEFDDETEEAIKIVEKANNLPVTGTLNLYSSAAIFVGRSIRSFIEDLKTEKNIVPLHEDESRQIVQSGDDKDSDIKLQNQLTKAFDPRGVLNDSRLHPKVREMAIKTAKILQEQGFHPYLLETYRSAEDQRAAYQRGASRVTFGWHNTGLAIDIGHYNKSGDSFSYLEDDPKLASRFWPAVGKAGLEAGFTEWGGNWQGFVDRPHLQYNPKKISLKRAKEAFLEGGIEEVWKSAVG